MPQQQQPGWLESILTPLFNRLGLNGNAALTATQQSQTPAKPSEHIMTDSEMRSRGFSDVDIAYYHAMKNIKK